MDSAQIRVPSVNELKHTGILPQHTSCLINLRNISPFAESADLISLVNVTVFNTQRILIPVRP